MKLFFSKSARQEYERFKSDSPDIAEKVKSILKDTVAHPKTGAGTPAKLEGIYSGLWQRTFSPGQVIVYSFDDKTVTVISIGARDMALKKVRLESYSEQDEKSVMKQMAANRGKDGEAKVGIFFHMADGTYEVAVGKWIEEYPQAYELILDEFNLPPEKTKARYSIHWDIGQSWR